MRFDDGNYSRCAYAGERLCLQWMRSDQVTYRAIILLQNLCIDLTTASLPWSACCIAEMTDLAWGRFHCLENECKVEWMHCGFRRSTQGGFVQELLPFSWLLSFVPSTGYGVWRSGLKKSSPRRPHYHREDKDHEHAMPSLACRIKYE